jgi:SapB morphogen precursor RamS
MAILDMQDMKPETRNWGGGSHLSVALCDSVASVTLCL